MTSDGAAYKAADVILVDKTGRILLFLRDDIATIPWPGCWDLIGGIVEDGETIEAAARREVAEECGYAVGELRPFGVYHVPHGRDGATCESHVFSGRIDAVIDELRLSPDEGQALQFFAPEELAELKLIWDGRIVQDFLASPQYLELVAPLPHRNGSMPGGHDAAEPQPAEDADVIERMLMRVDAGTPWHHAILSAIGEWRSPEETLEDGRQYRYVIGGEAFDWLLLAERLSEELNGALPPDAHESLLFNGVLPEQLSDDEFKRLIGQDKYRAHLNYLYGVRVEEALLLAVEEELHKEWRGDAWRADRVDDTAYHRIYNKGREELRAMFREETGWPDTGERVGLAEMREFTYWLFKFRLRRAEPARIASDTRKGIAQINRLQNTRRSHPSMFTTSPLTETFIDTRARVR